MEQIKERTKNVLSASPIIMILFFCLADINLCADPVYAWSNNALSVEDALLVIFERETTKLLKMRVEWWALPLKAFFSCIWINSLLTNRLFARVSTKTHPPSFHIPIISFPFTKVGHHSNECLILVAKKWKLAFELSERCASRSERASMPWEWRWRDVSPLLRSVGPLAVYVRTLVLPSCRVQKFQSMTPCVEKASFIAPSAAVSGDTVIGANSSIWYGGTVRGRFLFPVDAFICRRCRSYPYWLQYASSR